MLSRHRVIVSLLVTISILVVALAAIFWARGFKPDFKTGRIERTGLIVANSTPTGAQVYLDDRLTSATNTTITYLEPKTYKVRIEKEGYTAWQKDIEVAADLASEIKALLFPTTPEIKPLTTTGSFNPTLSPDGTKIIYGATGQRAGLYLLPLPDRPLALGQVPKLLAKNTPQIDYTKAKFIWAPDSKQVISQFNDELGNVTDNLLIDTEKTDQNPLDITASLTATLRSWQQDLDARAQTLSITVPQSIKDATQAALPADKAGGQAAEANLVESQSQESKSRVKTDSTLPTLTLNYFPTGLIFSPDEEKVLYLDKNASPRSPRGEAGGEAGKYQVYDLKTKKNFTLPLAAQTSREQTSPGSAGGQADLANLLAISWYPDSGHLVVAQNPPGGGQISIIEFDGSNKMIIYSGKFENNFVFAHPSGTRLIILTTLTQQEGSPPNLYSVNLK